MATVQFTTSCVSAEDQWEGHLPSAFTDGDVPLVVGNSDASGHGEIALAAVLDQITVPSDTKPYYEVRIQTTLSANVLGAVGFNEPYYDTAITDTYFEPLWWDFPGGGAADLTGDGVVKITFPYGFEFPFYGRYCDHVWVSENGFAVLGMETLSSGYFEYPSWWPNSDAPNGVVAPYWKELDMSSGGRLLYGFGNGGNGANSDWYDIMWDSVESLPQGEIQSFKIRLISDGSIEFWYREITLEFKAGPKGYLPDFAMGLEDTLAYDGDYVDFGVIDDLSVVTFFAKSDNKWHIEDINLFASKSYSSGSNDYDAELGFTGTYNGKWGGRGVELDWADLYVRPYDDVDHRLAAQTADTEIESDPIGVAYSGEGNLVNAADVPESYYPSLYSGKFEPSRTDLGISFIETATQNTDYTDGVVGELWVAPVILWRLYDDEQYTPGGLAANIHRLTIFAEIHYVDNYGQPQPALSTGSSILFGLNAPNEAPSAVIDSVSPNPATQGTTVYFNGHGTDTDGTIVGYNWRSSVNGQLSTSQDFSTSTLSSGTHTIYYKVQDDDGDWSPEVTTTLDVNARPTAVIDSIQPNPTAQGQIVTFNGHGVDTDGTIVSWEWTSSIDGTLSISEDFSTYSLSVGMHTIGYKVKDNDNAWSTSVYLGLEVLPDNPALPPVTTLEMLPYEADWYSFGVAFRLHATDDSGIIAYTTYKIDDGIWELYEGTTVYILDEGVHVVLYYSVDGDGNVESVNVKEVRIDLSDPTVTCDIEGKKKKAIYFTPVEFHLAASDELSGIRLIQYRIDGGAWVFVYASSCTAVISVDGTHTFEYYAVDNVSNVSTAKLLTVKIDL